MATRVVQFILDLKGDADAKAKETGSSMSDMAAKATLATGALAALSGAILGAATAYTTLLFDMEAVVDETNTFAQSTGASTEMIAGLRQVARATGKDLNALINPELPKRILEAQQGTGEMAVALGRLEAASGKTIDVTQGFDGVLRQTVDALASVEDRTLRAGLAASVGGPQFQEFLSAVGSSEGLDAFVAQAEKFGIRVGPDAVAAVGQWQTANANLALAFDFAKQSLLDAFGFETAAGLVNGFASAFVTMTQLVRTFTADWLERAGFFVAAFRDLFGGLSTFAEQSIGFWVDLFDTFGSAVGFVFDGIEARVRPALDAVGAAVQGVAAEVGTRVSLVADTLTSVVVDRVSTVLQVLGTIKGAAEVAAVGVASPFVEAFEAILSAIRETLGAWTDLVRAIPGASPLIDAAADAADRLSGRVLDGTRALVDGIAGAADNLGNAFQLPTTLVGKLASDAAATRAEFEALAAATTAAGGPTEAGAGATGIQAAADLAAAQKEAQKEAERLAKEAEKAAEKRAAEAAKQREEQIKLAEEIANGSTASVMALEGLGEDLERQMGPSVLGQSIGLAMAGPVGLIGSMVLQLPDMIDSVAAGAMDLFNQLNNFPTMLREALTETVPLLLTEVLPGILKAAINIVDELPGILVDMVGALIPALWDLFFQLPGLMISAFWEVLTGIPTLIIEALKAIPADIGRAVVEALGKLPKKVGEFIGPEGGFLGTQLGAQADTKRIFGIDLPFLDVGGTVTRTGLAVVHAGEEFSGVGANRRSMGGGGISIGTLNLNGVQNPRQFVDKLNQMFGANGLNLPALQGFTP